MNSEKMNKLKKIFDLYVDNEMTISSFEEPATLTLISNFESKIGFHLPSDFIALSLTKEYHAADVFVNEDIWKNPICGDRGPAWTFENGFEFYGFHEDLDEEYHIPSIYKKILKEFGHNVVPFMGTNTDPDLYCFTKKGDVIKWNHETNQTEKNGAVSFIEFLEIQLKELLDRKERYKVWIKSN